MEGIMRTVMNLLASLIGIYMLLIFIRIILTWFSGARYGRPVEILGAITDPYLNWWRTRFNLKAGFLDLSPIAGMAALSLAQTIFSTIAVYGRISAGIILSVALSSVWSAVSFILGFFIVVLILRLIAYLTNRDTYSNFWHIIDAISAPLLFRITRFFYKDRILNYLSGVIFSLALLLGLFIAGGAAVHFGSRLLLKLPI
jgi:YggT family protein